MKEKISEGLAQSDQAQLSAVAKGSAQVSHLCRFYSRRETHQTKAIKIRILNRIHGGSQILNCEIRS